MTVIYERIVRVIIRTTKS